MSSRPLSRQCLRNGSMSKCAEKPSLSVNVCRSRLMVIFVLWIGGAALQERCDFFFSEATEDDAVLAGVGEEDVCECGRDDGTRNPYWLMAQAACSRELPQAKLRSAMRISEPLYSGLLRMKSGLGVVLPCAS